MRRKHKTRHIVIALLLLLGVSGAAALAMLPAGYGSGNQGNFAFLPTELLSIFKKAEPPAGGQPQEPRTYAAYQPGEIPELSELPDDMPEIELADEGTVPGEVSGMDGAQGTGFNKMTGAPGQSPQFRGTSGGGTDGGIGGGTSGGSGGVGGSGGSPVNTMAASTFDDTTECTEGVDCEETCTEGVDCEDNQQNAGTCTEGVDCEETCTEGVDCENDQQNAGTCIEGVDCPPPVCDEVTVSSTIPCYEPDPNDDGQQASTEPPVNVDEPGPLSLLLVGALGLALARRARRKAQGRGTTPNA